MFYQVVNLKTRLGVITWLWLSLVTLGAILTILFGNVEIVEAITRSAWIIEQHGAIETLTRYSMYPFYILFIAVLIVGWIRRDKYLRLLGWAYFIAQLAGAALIVRILKIMTGHARPNIQDPALINSWNGPSLESSFNSFPSGHTADLFTSAIFVAMLLPNLYLRIIILAFAVLIGLTRIALSAHYPVDVTGGAFIGGLTTLLVVRYWLFPRLEICEQTRAGNDR